MATVIKDMHLRRLIEFNNKSKSLGVSIPAEWCDILNLSKKDYVKLELSENGFSVERVNIG